MSTRLAHAIVRAAAKVIADRGIRARYREQWLADVDGAAELDLSAMPVALGAATAAVRLAAGHPRSGADLVNPDAGAKLRRRFGIIQLAAALPYLWAVAFYVYARLRLGISHTALLYERGAHDPAQLIIDWFPPFWAYGPSMVWLALGGWAVAAALAPAGLVMAIGGRRSARWLPLAGTIAAVAVTALAFSEFGTALRTWLLD
jgi:hypothetical protein